MLISLLVMALVEPAVFALAIWLLYRRIYASAVRAVQQAASTRSGPVSYEEIAQKAVVTAVNDMLAHPEAKMMLLRAMKTARPEACIPELETRH